MLSFLFIAFIAHAQASAQSLGVEDAGTRQERIRALIVTGGCCHDYYTQTGIYMATIGRVLPVDWTVVYEGGSDSSHFPELYNDPNWFDGYDVVVHNECYLRDPGQAYFQRMTAAARSGIPAVVLHCSMHAYRDAEANEWRELLGVTTHRHTPANRVEVSVTAPNHSIMQGFPNEYVTPIDELYIVTSVWPNTTTLATGINPGNEADRYPVVWTNDHHGTRIFGTTIGHSVDTWREEIYQNLLVRGFMWALGRDQDLARADPPAGGQ